MSHFRKSSLAATLAAVVGTELFSSFYDDLLYPFAIATFGPLYGGVGVSIGAIILNFLMVVWYRRTETDWYSFEAAREAEAMAAAHNASTKIASGRSRTFVYLAILDPFLAFAYMEGRKGTMSMDKRDWAIFALANAIGIGVWLLVLLVIFAAGGLISERVADWVMYAFGAYGLFRILRGMWKQRVTSR